MHQAGIDFAFIKLTEGTSFIDSRFSQNWQGAKAAGILRGAYHFYKSGLDPVRQAQHFAELLPSDSDLPPVVDVEDNSQVPNNLAFRLLIFLKRLGQLTGRKPIIYTGAWFWNPHIAAQDWASDYDLWIAAYTSASSPKLPTGFKRWKFWQYTNQGHGPSYGASSNSLDLNRFAGSLAELKSYASDAQNQPSPPPSLPAPLPTEEPLETFWKIGWHAGVGGNRYGIGDYMRRLDEAGIPFSVKSVHDAGLAVEAAQYARKSGLGHNIILRFPIPAGRSHDKPDFSLSPPAAAREHWALIKSVIPPEVEPFKDIIWIEPTNEIDTHSKANWLGHFMVEIAKLMNADGYRALLSGFNAGQPEKEHWFLPGLRSYLELAAERPEQVAVSLHEGKTSGTKNEPIEDFYPHMIGRFEALFAACDEMGFARPTTFLSEWAWSYNDMPEPASAMEDLEWLARTVAQYPELRGVFLWCLQGGSEWGNLPDKLVRLMKPVTEKTLTERFQIEPSEPPKVPPEEPGDSFEERLRETAKEKQLIHFNRGAALQKRMAADDYVAMSEEFELLNDAGFEMVAQSAYNLAGKPERIYLCPVGRYDQVTWLPLLA